MRRGGMLVAQYADAVAARARKQGRIPIQSPRDSPSQIDLPDPVLIGRMWTRVNREGKMPALLVGPVQPAWAEDAGVAWEH
jgi:hypothetical protein